MCSGSPRVSTPPPAPTPAPPIASPSGDEIAPTLKVAEDKMTEEEKKRKLNVEVQRLYRHQDYLFQLQAQV